MQRMCEQTESGVKKPSLLGKMKAPRTLTQHVMKGFPDVCWWESSYSQESLQVMTEEIGHQEKGTKKKSV